jgi:putative hydrolase of the HAD superfamily
VSAVRAVLFDFYGTLAHATEWGAPYEEVFARRGHALVDDARARWTHDAWDGLEHVEHSVDRDTYVAWERSRLAEMARASGVGDDDVEALVDDLHREAKAWTMAPYPETHEVLEAVRDRGLTVAVCSNWDWDLDRALHAADLGPLIDVRVTSAQAGARKPHRRIFDRTLHAVGVEATEAVMVGDTWAADVEGPLALGMRALHVLRPGDSRASAVPEALPAGAARSSDLWAVLDLL